MIVVSDTSPLLNLSRINRLELLLDLYGEILIPPKVEEELTRVRDVGDPGAEVLSAPWLRVAKPSDIRKLDELSRDLDPGEAEAIALAMEQHADWLLVDERKARRAAASRGLKVIGLLGVLMSAKQGGYIAQIKPVLDDLIHVARFWIAADLYNEVLKKSGE